LHGREPGSHRCGAESQAGDAHGDTDPQAVTHRWGTECGERFHVGHSRKLGTTFLCPVGAKQARGSDSVPDGPGKCTYQACSRSGSSTAGRTAPVSSTSSGYGAFARPALPCLWWACTHMDCSYGCPVPPAQRGECDPWPAGARKGWEPYASPATTHTDGPVSICGRIRKTFRAQRKGDEEAGPRTGAAPPSTHGHDRYLFRGDPTRFGRT